MSALDRLNQIVSEVDLTADMPLCPRKRQHCDESSNGPPMKKVNRDQENCTPPEMGYPGPPMMNSTPLFNMTPQGIQGYNQQGMFFPPVPCFNGGDYQMAGGPAHFDGSAPFPSMEAVGHAHFDHTMTSSNDSGMSSDMSSVRGNGSLEYEGEVEEDKKEVFPFDQVATIRPLTDVFTNVPGRMTLLSASTKYKVTVAEVHRRLSPPECLHASLINGMLRKAKAKDGNKDLRRELLRYGITLPSGRRKMAPTTAFTALCEEEAVTMAHDYSQLCTNPAYFRSADIAEHYVREVEMTGDQMRLIGKRQQLVGAREFLTDMFRMLSTVGKHPGDFKPNGGSLENAINHFSLITHGFGHNALKGSVQALINVASDGIRNIDTKMVWPMQQQQLPQQPGMFYH